MHAHAGSTLHGHSISTFSHLISGIRQRLPSSRHIVYAYLVLIAQAVFLLERGHTLTDHPPETAATGHGREYDHQYSPTSCMAHLLPLNSAVSNRPGVRPRERARLYRRLIMFPLSITASRRRRRRGAN